MSSITQCNRCSITFPHMRRLDCCSPVVSWEIRIVMELCDGGALKDLITSQATCETHQRSTGAETSSQPPASHLPPEGNTQSPRQSRDGNCYGGSITDRFNRQDMGHIAATALDVARGLRHLHRNRIIHGDLKPHNVLLRLSPADARGFVAKVADFGLSVRMRGSQTHVSGTAHVSPCCAVSSRLTFYSESHDSCISCHKDCTLRLICPA